MFFCDILNGVYPYQKSSIQELTMARENKNFEEKLLEISDAEALKNAKQLLKSNQISCVYRDAQNRIRASFVNRNGIINTIVRTGDNAFAECDCRKVNDNGRLCEHAVAAIMYASRYNGKIKLISDQCGKYSGMLMQSYADFLKNGTPPPPAKRAYLRINVNSEFPHVPSKWEHSALSVRLYNSSGREYLGSQSNLRHLYFDKMLAVSLQIENFSLQEQQIIRFLAIHGEANGSMVHLDAEQTAEFFHCLIGFNDFSRDGRKLIIHGEYAYPVILQLEQNGKKILTPGIRINDTLLDMNSANVITGRSGCWVGRQGEYYFVPAVVDVAFLRNFFRTGRQEFPKKLPDTFSDGGKFAFPVVSTRSVELENLEHKILLGGDFDCRAMKFTLNIQYIYKGLTFTPDSGRLAIINNRFYRRNEEAEKIFENELDMFGFEKENSSYTLNNIQNIGVFLDCVLPEWLKKYPHIILDGKLATLANGSRGLSGCTMQCTLKGENNGKYTINYKIFADGSMLSLKSLLKNAAENRRYIASPDGIPVRCSDDFNKFLTAFSNIAENINEEEQHFDISFFSIPYFINIGGNIAGAVPHELYQADPLSDSNTAVVNETSAVCDFPFKGELRPYQQQGVEFLCTMNSHNFNVILADEMGLGKTVQVLATLSRMQKKNMPPSLVVCPASLLFNWEREAKKFVPSMKVIQLAGANRADEWKDIAKYDLVIISYSVCNRDIDLIRKTQFNFVILDEAQHIKNPGTANAQTCKSLRSAHRLVLTGTPLENSPEDLWSIFDFLHRGMLGSFASFKRCYADIADNPALQQDLAARVSAFIKRRTKHEVAKELPPKQEHTYFCEMSAEQRDLYEKVRLNGFNMLKNYSKGGTVNTEIFTTLLRLRQICCHPHLLPDFAEDAEFPSAKMELLHELLHEHIDSGHKVLLFSQFTSILSVIEKYLKEQNISYEYLDGTTRNRQQRVDNFNNDDNIKIFLLSLKAGGTGLNLTSADTVIIYDPWWNPAVELQAADRTHRIGQTRPVNSMKLLVRDSIEEKILRLQEKKQDIFDNVIDNPNISSEKLSVEDLKFLLA